MTIHIQMLQDIATHARAMADSMQAIVDDCAEQLAKRKTAGESEESIMNEPFNKAAQNDWTPMDAGIAMNNMTLAAWEEGVGSCILGNVARVPLAKLLDIPEQMHVYTVVAFGYPTHRSTLREVEPSEDLTYYLDENRDYVVPRKKIEEVIQFR